MSRLPNRRSAQSLRLFLVFTLIFSTLAPAFLVKNAEAAFTQAYIRLNRMTASTALSGVVCAKTATSGTEDKVLVTFPSDFTISTTGGDWTVSTTNLPESATAWPNIGSAAVSVSGQTVTWDAGTNMDLSSSSTLYCFNFVGANSTTGSAGNSKTGTITTQTSAAAQIDTVSYATAIVSSGGDQISVSASVSPTFSFALGGSTAALGTLSTSSVTSASAVTMTIGTNANNGWVAWVKGANNASGYSYLNSPSTSATIGRAGGTATIDDTPESLAAQTGYVLDVNSNTQSSTGDGTFTVDAEYNGADTNSGGTISNTFQEIATSDGTTGGDILDLVVRAKIDAAQEAATDYADTLTVVAAGKF